MIQVKDIQIRAFRDASRKGCVGIANFTINNFLTIRSVGIYKRLNGDGFRLLFPYKIFPCTREAGRQIEDAVVREYERKVRGFAYV